MVGIFMDERITKHLELVIEANKITNLTRIDSFEDGMLLHVEDSLAGLPEMMEAPAGRYGDMGTGGGFPGIPLAIQTGRETVLMDSVGKKTKLLDGFIEQLDLGSLVSTYNGRLEELAAQQPESFVVLTARALSKLGSLMELASPLLVKGGRLVCYKANVAADEYDHAVALENKLGMKLVGDREFFLSDGITHRRILVFEKFRKPSIPLPRHTGYAQKKPL